jgi:hypothetical protein
LTGKTEVLEENLSQYRFVHHKPHMLSGSEPGPPRWKSATNRLSYHTALTEHLLSLLFGHLNVKRLPSVAHKPYTKIHLSLKSLVIFCSSLSEVES